MSSHTYTFHSSYGSDEIQKQTLTIEEANVTDDGLRVHLQVAVLRELFVHELSVDASAAPTASRFCIRARSTR